jgi:hypothetical protein
MVRRCLSVISVISILEVAVAQDIPEATKVRMGRTGNPASTGGLSC